MYVKKAAETTYERKTHVCLTLMKLTPGLSKKRNGFLWNEDFLANSSFHFDRYPLRPKCRQKLEQKMHFQISKRKKRSSTIQLKQVFDLKVNSFVLVEVFSCTEPTLILILCLRKLHVLKLQTIYQKLFIIIILIICYHYILGRKT